MSTILGIPKSPQLQDGENFTVLREAGLDEIRDYAGNTWTDHNLHDPGITTLEAFCYVLTELSLQAGLDIKDLLASGIPDAHSALFAPEISLPTQAITARDYRKLLIDSPGVRNGWLIPLPLSDADGVNGLYEILLELDEDPILGDLNRSIQESSFTIDYGGGDVRSYTVEISFPSWNETEVLPFRELVVINAISSPASPVVVLTATSPGDHHDYFSELEITYNGVLSANLSITVRVTPKIGADAVENAAVENKIITLLSEAPGGGPLDQSLLTVFNRKAVAVTAVQVNVTDKLRTQRNLSEDLLGIDIIRIQEIGVKATIDILGPVNPERLLARIIYELERFFRPPIQAESLEGMEKKGISYEKIFEGPRLNSGILPDTLLDDLPRGTPDDRNSTIFVSDLLNLLLSQAGTGTASASKPLLAVSSLSISNFIRNIPVAQNATDCLILANPLRYKPRFSFTKSNFRFYRNGLEFNYNSTLVNELLDTMRSLGSPNIPGPATPKPPIGQKLDFGGHHSIQYDFPAAYGLAENVLSDRYPLDKRAKAEQFRGYLFLLDALLASQTGLVLHLNELFSINPASTQTYFKDPLYAVPYLNRILEPFTSSGLTWDAFQADPSNAYQNALDTLAETREVFLDRRNRFLNHLLGRFQADVSAYESLLFDEDTATVQNSADFEERQWELSEDLIGYKIRYLKRWPNLSAMRFAGFNYEGVAWDTDNVSGLVKTLLTRMGLENQKRRTLFNEADGFITTVPDGPNFRFQILDSASNPVLMSAGTFAGVPAARQAAMNCLQNAVERDNYYLESQVVAGGGNQIGMQPDPLQLPVFLAVPTGAVPPDSMEARRQIRQLMGTFREIGAGLYLVEHILLRPEAQDPLALNFDIPQGEGILAQDPYSMRLTFILPSGFQRDFGLATDPQPAVPGQFRSEKFRAFVQREIRLETPAHLLPRIFWLDINSGADLPTTPSLNNFTQRWRAWLEAKADTTTPIATLRARRNELVMVLNAMYQTL